MKISKEAKTAVIVLSGIILFILGMNFLMSNSIFSNARTYYAEFDHSGGLQPSTPVTVNGKKIGTVSEVELRQSDSKIVVTFNVDSDYQFSKNSTAELYKSLLGNAGLQIIPAQDNAGYAQAGTTIKSRVQTGMVESITNQLDPLRVKLEKALTSADTLINNLNSVLDDQTKHNLKSSISGLNDVVGNFKDASNNFNDILENNKEKLTVSLDSVQSITGNVASITSQIEKGDIEASLIKFNNAMTRLDSLMANLEGGEGNLGKLLKDEQLYDNLKGASKQLEELLQDMKLNPKRYVHFSVFGKKNKEYQPPSDENQ
ncbi:MlaD family protein [Neptunitalea lumnitzerae]|uniref:Organic solvent ABC transporter substrate-binding protein n=1 Tax=Neptunitalea lumnitzerae TaxID=2965509 RepID=A0ABQ5MLF1_9FLAO|nr:MlaD family protein [Neptunitalea sp. Y10]GLB50209.1 organic solvent ABC transporter substrate-binding protein [Neptunitalea sp. Y10]